MELKIETQKKWALVFLEGRMDSFNYELITKKISTLVKMGKNQIGIIVENVNFLSLPCLRFFSSLGLKLKKNNGRLAFVGAGEKILKDLEAFNVENNYLLLNSLDELNSYEQTREL